MRENRIIFNELFLITFAICVLFIVTQFVALSISKKSSVEELNAIVQLIDSGEWEANWEKRASESTNPLMWSNAQAYYHTYHIEKEDAK